MKQKILGWLRAIRTFVVKRLLIVGRFFYVRLNMRPGLKRGLFAFALYGALALPAAVAGVPLLAMLWAPALVMLFLGMGAERASLEWDPVFALPRARDFAFWRWHALEKKRFSAVLIALGFGLLLSLSGGGL